MQIDGQEALVTGAGSGLGAATARHLAALGARVAVLDFDAERARAVADDIGGLAVPADVGDAAAVEAAFAKATDAFGAAPRIVVNCAGIAPAARVVGREGKLSIDQFERAIRVNLIGTFIVLSHGARGMAARDPIGPDGERGVIVNTASVAWEDGQFGQTAYAASKGGVAALALPAARELARSGVRVMTIAPGLFHTPMMESLPDEVTAKIVSDIQYPARLGQAAEYARLVEAIVTNPYLNATTIRLDAGVRLPPR